MRLSDDPEFLSRQERGKKGGRRNSDSGAKERNLTAVFRENEEDAVIVHAAKKGMSISAFIRFCVMDYMEQNPL
jgi:hypothetical protein